MIQVIGLMIGAYIFTRMLGLMIDKNPQTHSATRIFAMITAFIAVVGCFLLIVSGASLSSHFPQ